MSLSEMNLLVKKAFADQTKTNRNNSTSYMSNGACAFCSANQIFLKDFLQHELVTYGMETRYAMRYMAHFMDVCWIGMVMVWAFYYTFVMYILHIEERQTSVRWILVTYITHGITFHRNKSTLYSNSFSVFFFLLLIGKETNECKQDDKTRESIGAFSIQ